MTEGIIAAIAAAGVWALSAMLMATQTSRVDPLSISAIRAVWGASFVVVLLFAAGAQADLGAMSAGTIVELVLSAVVALALGDTLYVISIGLLGMNRSFTMSVGLYAVMSFALGAIFLDERVRWDTVLGSGLVLVGVYLVSIYGRSAAAESTDPDGQSISASRPPIAGAAELQASAGRGSARLGLRGHVLGPRHGTRLGLVLVALAALAWAISTVWLRDASEDFDALAVSAVRLPAAALVIGMAAGLRPGTALRRRSLSRRSLGVLVFAGIVGTGLGSWLFIFAVQEVGAGRTAVLSSVSPLFALPLGALVLGEPITRWVALGTALAVVGIVLIA